MESILQAKKGKSNLTVGNNDLYYQKETLSESIPKIVPLYDGQELKINQNLITNGLATISIRNLRSNEFAIKRRNSFINLHRPELKGLNIVSTENRRDKMLQQRILTEPKPINQINSMKSICKNENRLPCLLLNNEAYVLEKTIKSEAALLIAKHSLKELKPVAVEMFNQQKKRTDGCTDTGPELTTTDKFCPYDMEIKSTLIH